MKISEKIKPEHLERFGFVTFNKNNYCEELQYCDAAYILDLGNSRRGQHYYFLVSSKMVLTVFASKPDGSGGELEMPETAIDFIYFMKKNGFFVL